jgi:hypothetical protein
MEPELEELLAQLERLGGSGPDGDVQSGSAPSGPAHATALPPEPARPGASGFSRTPGSPDEGSLASLDLEISAEIETLMGEELVVEEMLQQPPAGHTLAVEIEPPPPADHAAGAAGAGPPAAPQPVAAIPGSVRPSGGSGSHTKPGLMDLPAAAQPPPAPPPRDVSAAAVPPGPPATPAPPAIRSPGPPAAPARPPGPSSPAPPAGRSAGAAATPAAPASAQADPDGEPAPRTPILAVAGSRVLAALCAPCNRLSPAGRIVLNWLAGSLVAWAVIVWTLLLVGGRR